MTITWTTFAIRLLVGFFLAVGIGIERQWLKTRSILKTNVLVTLGSAMFVMLSIMTPGDASPTRISAQIVSGVGFLGGGVILREGASVRGINTAATLWCAAAIGTLVGSGYLVQAYVSTLAVVGANLLLRPLVEAFKRQSEAESQNMMGDRSKKKEPDADFASPFDTIEQRDRFEHYSCHVVCLPEAEVKVLKLILDFSRERHLNIVGIESQNIDTDRMQEVKIVVDLASQAQSYLSHPEEIVSAIKAEAKVHSVSWRSRFK